VRIGTVKRYLCPHRQHHVKAGSHVAMRFRSCWIRLRASGGQGLRPYDPEVASGGRGSALDPGAARPSEACATGCRLSLVGVPLVQIKIVPGPSLGRLGRVRTVKRPPMPTNAHQHRRMKHHLSGHQ